MLFKSIVQFIKLYIKRKITEATNRYMEQKSREIENMAAHYDNFNHHKKIKEMTGLGRKRQYTQR